MRNALTAIHITLCCILVGLAAVLDGSQRLFNLPSFREFSEIGSERAWANVFLVAAILGGVGLVVDRRWSRQVASFLLATVHGVIAICFILGEWRTGPVTTAVATYTCIAGLGYYLTFRRFTDTEANGPRQRV